MEKKDLQSSVWYFELRQYNNTGQFIILEIHDDSIIDFDWYSITGDSTDEQNLDLFLKLRNHLNNARDNENTIFVIAKINVEIL